MCFSGTARRRRSAPSATSRTSPAEHVTGRSSGVNGGPAAGPAGSTTGPAAGRSIIGMSVSRAVPSPVPVPSGGTPDGDGIGVGNGPVRVEAYIDFGCPFCRQFELMSGPALDRLLADRLISFIRHPMDFLDAVSTTAYSTRAAAAS